MRCVLIAHRPCPVQSLTFMPGDVWMTAEFASEEAFRAFKSRLGFTSFALIPIGGDIAKDEELTRCRAILDSLPAEETDQRAEIAHRIAQIEAVYAKVDELDHSAADINVVRRQLADVQADLDAAEEELAERDSELAAARGEAPQLIDLIAASSEEYISAMAGVGKNAAKVLDWARSQVAKRDAAKAADAAAKAAADAAGQAPQA
jgi:chromosome segregation ATPase